MKGLPSVRGNGFETTGTDDTTALHGLRRDEVCLLTNSSQP